MANDAGDRLQALGMFASALAGRPVAVAPLDPGEPSWTDGQIVFVDPSARPRANLESVAVHASLIAADSLAPDVVGALVRHPRLARRYLAVEGHRALAANGNLLPGVLNSLADPEMASRSDSPASSLSIASGKVPRSTIHRRSSASSVPKRLSPPTVGRPRRWITRPPGTSRAAQSKEALEELDDGEVDDTDDPDLFTSPVGGGGFIGKWLKKMLSSVRKREQRRRTARRRCTDPPNEFGQPRRLRGVIDRPRRQHRRSRRHHAGRASRTRNGTPIARDTGPDWCTVHEVEPKIKASATQAIDDAIARAAPARAARYGTASSPPPATG